MWIGVSWPSCEFILSFSHEGAYYRAMVGKVSRYLVLRRYHGTWLTTKATIPLPECPFPFALFARIRGPVHAKGYVIFRGRRSR